VKIDPHWWQVRFGAWREKRLVLAAAVNFECSRYHTCISVLKKRKKPRIQAFPARGSGNDFDLKFGRTRPE